MATEEQRGVVMKKLAKNRIPALIDKSDDFVGLFEQYLESIKDEPKAIPTYSNFATWLGNFSADSIYSFMRRNPDARDRTAELMADSLIEKSMTGQIKEVSTIFALKNRCNWTDKKENISKHEMGEIASAEEVSKNLKSIFRSLGYDAKNRPRAGSAEKLEEMESRMIRLAEAKAGA